MLFDDYCEALESLPSEAIDSVVRSAAMVAIALEGVIGDPDNDPAPVLEACFARQLSALVDARLLVPHLASGRNATNVGSDMRELFENAWAGYSDATFDHAVSLIDNRLERSGIGPQLLRGSRCLDGGCGIGRFSVAMAKLGAGEVIAVDIGQQSLDYTDRQAKRSGLTSIKTVRQDITDLSSWPDESFDFVVSYGVLHHTPDPMKGLFEHFRVLRPGGVFWLYLYGAGGMYWPTYDRLRSVLGRYPVKEVKCALERMGLREGLVYTFLDNILAPRTYHRESEIVAALRQINPDLVCRRASGSSVIDDVGMCLKTRFGRTIVGPEGEVRLVITKGSETSIQDATQ